ncbi:MAG: FAD-dependent oxidoreductase [Bryobacteraceae bacterium]|nr:FAD-dependent oxidoreductase [Bryobacteraceae bacterium]MDW8379033.1 FAD-dependent oxidoreductase [Bryobacterales bacterium]
MRAESSQQTADHAELLDRRRLLSLGLVGLGPKTERPVQGRFVDDSHELAHRLRDRTIRALPKAEVRIPVVIVGAGIAGLSAAWWLERRGFRDFLLLELEKQPGGNSRWGENEVSAYPWGAHYLPLPNQESTLVRELCREFGLLDAQGSWQERHLCHSPQERLFLHGRWQEGLEPELGVTRKQRDQFRRFHEKMQQFRETRQFTLPMELGAKPSPLDRISFSEWLRQEGFDSPYLLWYVDYACRDDYGSRARDTSAWAGIHYFAARERAERGPLTWPEGNGWLVRKLLIKLAKYVRTQSMVGAIRRRQGRLSVEARETAYLAQAVIWAAPTFVLRYVFEECPDTSGLTYSPWLTANLTLDRMPAERDSERAWDNVLFDSPALGYVVATHQNLASRTERSVWTYYWALADQPPARIRQMLLEKDWHFWKEEILRDLERAHPDIRQCVSRIDILRLGHAMVRPYPGWIFGETRRRLLAWSSDIVLANSDLSGLSVFEEAQYRGVRAAERVLRRLGRT